ncbi:MAG: hypothetical protein AAGE96_03925 [Cyanobacteria bacterium P01_G01_bin.19]
MTNLQQIKQVAAQLHLNLDNPQSVRQQLNRINESHDKLREFKQQVNTKLKEMKQPDNGFGLDEAASIGLHLFGKHRIAREVRRQGNRVERQQRRQQKNARQPYIKMKDLIDNYIFEADRLKTMAKNYLQEQKG